MFDLISFSDINCIQEDATSGDTDADEEESDGKRFCSYCGTRIPVSWWSNHIISLKHTINVERGEKEIALDVDRDEGGMASLSHKVTVDADVQVRAAVTLGCYAQNDRIIIVCSANFLRVFVWRANFLLLLFPPSMCVGCSQSHAGCGWMFRYA